MSFLAAMRKLWQSIAPRTRSDVEEEFRSTLDAYQEDLIRQGLSEEQARRKARIDLGQPAAQNETYRAAIGLRLFDELGGDIRYGLRALLRNPGFAAVAAPEPFDAGQPGGCSQLPLLAAPFRQRSPRHRANAGDGSRPVHDRRGDAAQLRIQ